MVNRDINTKGESKMNVNNITDNSIHNIDGLHLIVYITS